MIKTKTIKCTDEKRNQLLIRPAKPEEAKTIEQIELASFGKLHIKSNKIKWQIKKPNKYIYLVAIQHNEIIGYQAIELRHKHIFRLIGLGVLPQYQHLGIGRALFTAPEKIAKLNGINKLTLEVRASNAAQKLYFNCGYRVANFKHFYYVHPLESAIIMSKKVGN